MKNLRERASERGVLATVVAARRRELGLLQADLADLAGCSTRFVHDLEAGKRTLQLDKVLDVLATLGLRLELGNGPSSQVVPTAELAGIYDLGQAQATPGVQTPGFQP